jgi:hypothetical protein
MSQKQFRDILRSLHSNNLNPKSDRHQVEPNFKNKLFLAQSGFRELSDQVTVVFLNSAALALEAAFNG